MSMVKFVYRFPNNPAEAIAAIVRLPIRGIHTQLTLTQLRAIVIKFGREKPEVLIAALHKLDAVQCIGLECHAAGGLRRLIRRIADREVRHSANEQALAARCLADYELRPPPRLQWNRVPR